MVTTNTQTRATLSTTVLNINAAITALVENLDVLKKLEFETARQEELFLEDLIDSIKPVIKYLDKPYPVKKVVSSNRYYYEEYEEFEERVVPLIENHGWRQRRTDGKIESYYQGYAYLLTRSGQFVKLLETDTLNRQRLNNQVS